MQHKTDDRAPTRGVYHSNCKCRSELRVRSGDPFPNCSSCMRAVTWFFVRSYISGESMHPPAPAEPRLGNEEEEAAAAKKGTGPVGGEAP